MVEYKNLRFTVLNVEDRRIGKVKIEILPVEEEKEGGNVMCSRGSVIPLFIDRIRKGEPLTVTDPNMTRFLMNLDEAVDLVMFAFQHANPDVYKRQVEMV